MNPFELRWLRGLALTITLVLAACETGPQEPTIRLAQVAREVAGTEVRWQQAEPAEVGLRVWRDGQELRATRGMLLQRGDVVQTGPQSAAVIRFSGGNTGAATGTTTLAENTRVRLGSLEVFFGRVFANLRGLFETSSENIVAGVEGTRFLFEVRPDRSVAIAVAEGVVACRPRQAGWASVRLHALEALVSAYPNRTAPRVMPADARELRDAAAWADSVAEAPSQGWCCVDGRAVPSWSNRCGGNVFSTNRSIAESMCRPAPPPPPAQTGWCCAHGEIYPSSREQCAGSFSESAGIARRMCMPRLPLPLPPPPPPPLPPPPPPIVR
ncbi:MAG: FecR domain-containing protein [Burkholderiales bacterium]|nr:FecR domain-containing protein [Burkholderiales bacterium]